MVSQTKEKKEEPLVQFTPEIPIPTKPKLKKPNFDVPANEFGYWRDRIKELAKYYGEDGDKLIKMKPKDKTYKDYYKDLVKIFGAFKEE